jgi:hypothetical protein
MDLSTLEIGAIDVALTRPTSPTRQLYKESGAYMRCGLYDHWLDKCPMPARLNSASRSAGSSRKKVLIRAPDYNLDTMLEASSWNSNHI